MFADDTNFFIQGENLEKMENDLNIELKKLTIWLKTNKLSLNIQKTHTMTFSNTHRIRTRHNKIYIDGTEIGAVNYTNFLGIVIDNKLNWSEHIKHICNKISKSIGIINKVKYMLDTKILTNLYYSFIYPYITYCNIVWGRAPKIYLSKIHVLQKRLVRIISQVGFRDHTQPLFKKQQILNIYQVNKNTCCDFMYKHNRGMLPEIFNYVITLNVSPHSYNTRQGTTYKIPYCYTKIRQNTLAYTGSKYWNTIVIKNHLEDCTSLQAFKKRTKALILDECMNAEF